MPNNDCSIILDIAQHRQEMLMLESNTTTRVKSFLELFNNHFLWFEDMTGIKASKWRDLERGKTRAVTAEMIDALCSTWPEYAYWFVTGKIESPRGQCTPDDYLGFTGLGPIEPGGRRFWRDENGKLCPGLEIQSVIQEIGLAEVTLWFSAVMNRSDAIRHAPKFWAEFLEPLKKGEEITFDLRDLKAWANKIPIGFDESDAGNWMNRAFPPDQSES